MKKTKYWVFTNLDWRRSSFFSFLSFLYACFGISVGLVAQESQISGYIRDADTGKPISFAHVILPNKQMGTTSDADGFFRIITSSNEDSIIFSHVGYKTTIVSLNNFHDQKNRKILMHEQSRVLAEVRITPDNVNSYEPHEILAIAVAKYQRSRRPTPHIAKAYYSEKVRYSNSFPLMVESIGYSIYCGDTSNWTPLARQNFYCDITKILETDGLRRYSNNGKKPTPGNYILMNFQMYIESYGLLSKNNKAYKVRFKNKGFRQYPPYILTFSGNGERGLIAVSESFEINWISYKKTRKIWSTLYNQRISGKASIRYVYFNGVPFTDLLRISYKRGSTSHELLYQNLLQKLDTFQVRNDWVGALQRFGRNPLIKFDREKWKSHQLPYDKHLVVNNEKIMKYTKAHHGTTYYESIDFDKDAVDFVESLRRLF